MDSTTARLQADFDEFPYEELVHGKTHPERLAVIAMLGGMEPTNIVALNNLAFVLAVRRSAPAEAVSFARRAATLAPGSGAVLDTLGWIEHLLGNPDAAASLLEQAVRLEPGQANIRLHAAVVYVATGKRDAAEKELKETLRLDPTLEDHDDVRKLRERLAVAKQIR